MKQAQEQKKVQDMIDAIKLEQTQKAREKDEEIKRLEQDIARSSSTNKNIPMGPETVLRQDNVNRMRKELYGTVSAPTTVPTTVSGATNLKKAVVDQNSEIELLLQQKAAKQAALKSTTAVTNADWGTERQKGEIIRLKNEKMKMEQDAQTKQSSVASKVSAVNASIMAASKGIDLVFLMDCTGSMASWIKISKDKVVEIADSIKYQHPHLDLRLAFVAYRDFGDKKQIEYLDFTIYADEMKSFISTLNAEGGGDAPEDIAGGLEICKTLSWKSRARLIIHFADAPPHGKQYHNHSDNYPGGDPNDRIPEDILRYLSTELKVDYYFARLNGECDRMLEIFKQVYLNQDTNMKVVEVGSSVDQFVPLVTQSVSASVSASIARIVIIERIPKKTVY